MYSTTGTRVVSNTQKGIYCHKNATFLEKKKALIIAMQIIECLVLLFISFPVNGELLIIWLSISPNAYVHCPAIFTNVWLKGPL